MQEVNNLQKCIEKVEEHFNSRLENLAKLHMHSQQALQGIQQETQALQRQHKEELVSLGKQLTQARKKAAAHIRTTVDDYEAEYEEMIDQITTQLAQTRKLVQEHRDATSLPPIKMRHN
ncbi:hypothetical protein AURDEDRAFT_128885 [Auricularia subglabra TFB-10046 SS5]|nr:hypothetical protein AURDEDRAFT_128885 [Auricularia subglabra TFB-10046 SS5]